MKRLLGTVVLVLSSVMWLLGMTLVGTESPDSEAELPGGGLGAMVVNAQSVPVCQGNCSDLAHAWTAQSGQFAFSVFRVQPVLRHTPTPLPTPWPTQAPPFLKWQRHDAQVQNPPAVAIVSWGGNTQTMEILPDGTTPNQAQHPDIILHVVRPDACDSAPGETGPIGVNGMCLEAFEFDIDWQATVGGESWDWAYFWVRDPDFVAMKAIDFNTNCPTGAWPYEYVNSGPVYTICQDFGEEYLESHGIAGALVEYDVLYEPGAPPSPTSGPTTTPPVPQSPTPEPTPCTDMC